MSCRVWLGQSCVSNQSLSTTKCPISIYSVHAKLHAFDNEFDWVSSYHSRCFYSNYKPNTTWLESGYLKSTLLVKVHWFFFFGFLYLVFLQVYKPYSHHPLQQRIFYMRKTMPRICLQPSHRRLCPTAIMCAAMWHQSSTWMIGLLLNLLHMLLSRCVSLYCMSATYEEVFKSKRWSLGGAKPATSTLTLITSTMDIMPPISANDATASAQVAAGVSVSVQLCQLHLWVLINNKPLVCGLRDGFEFSFVSEGLSKWMKRKYLVTTVLNHWIYHLLYNLPDWQGQEPDPTDNKKWLENNGDDHNWHTLPNLECQGLWHSVEDWDPAPPVTYSFEKVKTVLPLPLFEW